MEYERIDKVQSGISISPSKLRMKLMGPLHRKKDGSNSNSSRTSPSRIEDAEFVNSLLASKSGEFYEEVPSLDVAPVKISNETVLDSSLNDQISSQPKESLPRESIDVGRSKLQQFSKSDNGNSSAIHPIRTIEDENLDYDSNASSSSFEFHKGERALPNSMTRSYSRPMSSKWNDAEKWIMNRQNLQATYAKKNAFNNQANRFHMTNMMPFEKFSFIPAGAHPISAQACGGNLSSDQYPHSKDLREVAQRESSAEDTTVVPAIRSVSMRDMGTEMTPVTSQEPSRTATPAGATTPLRSPTSSIPSTPRRGEPTSTPLDHTTDDESQRPTNNRKKELSEQELKLKTRREIVALGVQLGKMNIAAWASKDEKENNTSSVETSNTEEPEQIEYEKRAAAWEEAEKSRHTARYKREEIKIQAWESQQRAKLEAEMRRIEAKVEQMRAQAQAKMVKKIAMARQRSEEKRAAAEARKNREAERTAAQAEYIRQTGRMPSSHYICCGWLS
ncbi:PREDICTED: titin homolog isoform X2 [Theobroma cacao]|uniref:Titin homolog isoform X2 n=2 Tax=Theobroma cacao TaxID=3641 RepID=A0AB32WKP0_THECC|nr:PREDICTED: titin homolog isoform X2 [Theobroma cacao]EOY27589.1 Remorin family protein isoform 2 [Theobroma cacao]